MKGEEVILKRGSFSIGIQKDDVFGEGGGSCFKLGALTKGYSRPLSPSYFPHFAYAGKNISHVLLSIQLTNPDF